MKKRKRILIMIGTGVILFLLLMLFWGFGRLNAEANGWVDETSDSAVIWGQHSLKDYSIDYYSDEGGITGGISNIGYWIVNGLANALFQIAALFSYFCGWVLEQAYTVDFLGQAIGTVSTSIQKIAGVDSAGFRATGLLPALAPLLILLAGGYFVWVGLVKGSAARAAMNLVTFAVVFVFGMGVIAYSPSYLNMINQFQRDLNQEIIDISNEVLPGESGQGGVYQMRSNLFTVMIRVPYLLFQYGETDPEIIGEERVEELLSLAPGSEERKEVVKREVTELNNAEMDAGSVMNDLGMSLVVLIADLVVGVSVIILSVMLISGQVSFVLYASFFPVALVFSLFPNSGDRLKGQLNKCMESIMMRPGITIILTVVFSLSMLCYDLSRNGSFLWMMFLQGALYVLAVTKVKDLLGFAQIGRGGKGQDTPRFPIARVLAMSKILNGRKDRPKPMPTGSSGSGGTGGPRSTGSGDTRGPRSTRGPGSGSAGGPRPTSDSGSGSPGGPMPTGSGSPGGPRSTGSPGSGSAGGPRPTGSSGSTESSRPAWETESAKNPDMGTGKTGQEEKRRPGTGAGSKASGQYKPIGNQEEDQRRPGTKSWTKGQAPDRKEPENQRNRQPELKRRPGMPREERMKNRESQVNEQRRSPGRMDWEKSKQQGVYQSGTGRNREKTRSFQNVEQRQYDFDALETQLRQADLGKRESGKE